MNHVSAHCLKRHGWWISVSETWEPCDNNVFRNTVKFLNSNVLSFWNEYCKISLYISKMLIYTPTHFGTHCTFVFFIMKADDCIVNNAPPPPPPLTPPPPPPPPHNPPPPIQAHRKNSRASLVVAPIDLFMATSWYRIWYLVSRLQLL